MIFNSSIGIEAGSILSGVANLVGHVIGVGDQADPIPRGVSADQIHVILGKAGAFVGAERYQQFTGRARSKFLGRLVPIASLDQHSAKLQNPTSPTSVNLMAGLKFYRDGRR